MEHLAKVTFPPLSQLSKVTFKSTEIVQLSNCIQFFGSLQKLLTNVHVAASLTFCSYGVLAWTEKVADL